jgi:hypothetical protein
MPKRRRNDNTDKTTSKRNKNVKTRKRKRGNDNQKRKVRRTNTRHYTERWYRWREHLNDTKLANPHLEFGDVLVLASDTYDKESMTPFFDWFE